MFTTFNSQFFGRIQGIVVSKFCYFVLESLFNLQIIKDVPLITLASIYHQSGFSNSALIVASKALEISPNSVVAIHWFVS